MRILLVIVLVLSLVGVVALATARADDDLVAGRSPEVLFEEAVAAARADAGFRSRRLLRSAAEAGHAEAMLMLADFYRQGGWGPRRHSVVAEGLRSWRRDAGEAAYWTEHALSTLRARGEAGDPEAHFRLFTLYRPDWHHPGVEGDESVAEAWLQRAVAHRYPEALLVLGHRARRAGEYEAMRALYGEAAAQGDEMGHWLLASMHLQGVGVPRDVDRYAALRWEAVEKSVPGVRGGVRQELATLRSEATRGNEAAREVLAAYERLGVPELLGR